MYENANQIKTKENVLIKDIIVDMESKIKAKYPDGWSNNWEGYLSDAINDIRVICKNVITSYGIDTNGYAVYSMEDVKTRSFGIAFKLSDGSYVIGLWLKASFKRNGYKTLFNKIDLTTYSIKDILDKTLADVLNNREIEHQRQIKKNNNMEQKKKNTFTELLKTYNLSNDSILSIIKELENLDIISVKYNAESKIKELSIQDYQNNK